MLHFLALGKVSDFREGKMRAFKIGRADVALALINGRFHAFSNICTHRFAYLTDGFLIDGQIVCGEHEATYDPTTGTILYGPAFEPLPVYSVRVEGEVVALGWPEALAPNEVVAVGSDEDTI